MKTARTLFAATLLILSSATLPAAVEVPVLFVREKGQAKPLELTQLHLDVRLNGLFVETIWELEFFNKSRRQQEGEFVLSLPEGATVSTYALEVNGGMRPAVSVDQEQARFAYESIKRRRVDPGIVEKEEGNIYRTRIFPIQPNQPKRVRIGYIQNLAPVNGPAPQSLDFELPLQYDGDSIIDFSCRVEGALEQPTLDLPDLGGPDQDEQGAWEWRGRHIKLEGKLEAKSQPPSPDQAILESERSSDGSTYFALQVNQTIEPIARSKPQKVRVIWDASAAGSWRDHEAEFALLKRYWHWLGEVSVEVQILRNQLLPPVKFDLKNADRAADLEALLKSITYDGIANFSLIPPAPDATTLLFTKGPLSSPIWQLNPNIGDPYFLVTSGPAKIDSSLIGPATAHINLSSPDSWTWLTTSSAVKLTGDLKGVQWDLTTAGPYYVISAKLPPNYSGELRVTRGKTEIPIEWTSSKKTGSNWSFQRRLWAQLHANALEDLGDTTQIKEFAIAERLVSDYTSLIVLEEFSDHLRYGIPPPEPDLLIRYHTALGQQENSGYAKALKRWGEKQQWYETEFPWLDWELETQSHTVSIWVKASREIFPPEKLNAPALEPYETWLLDSRQTMDRKDDLESSDDFTTWQKEVAQRIDELNAIRIRNARAANPDPGQPIHVSVRGFVPRRAVYSAEAPLTLSQAVHSAGGAFDPYGSLARVYLYRDASRTGFNLLSNEYEDILLRWGDMIVVEGEGVGRRDWAADDPFAGLDDRPHLNKVAPNMPAVFEEPGAHPAPALNGGTGESPFQSSEAPDFRMTFVSHGLPLAMGLNLEIMDQWYMAGDRTKFYEELLANRKGAGDVSASTWIEIARTFFEQGDPAMGERALSNLFIFEANPIEATRAFACWLYELGATERAIEVLDALADSAPDRVTRALAQFDAANLLKDRDRFREALETELAAETSTAIATVALTEYFSRSSDDQLIRNRANKVKGFEVNAMPSDVRIVLNSMGADLHLQVEEPSKIPLNVFGRGSNNGWRDWSPRVDEYQIRRGFPGTYRVTCVRDGAQDDEQEVHPVTLQVTYYIRWGQPDQEMRTQTMLMEGNELILDGIQLSWPE